MEKILFLKALSEIDNVKVSKEDLRKRLLINREKEHNIPTNTQETYQLVIAMEELNELSQAISKYIRGKGDEASLLEELADVSIVLENVKQILDVKDEELEKAIEVKLRRVEQRHGIDSTGNTIEEILNDFINKYKTGDIVYPDAVARHCNLNKSLAVNKLRIRPDLKTMATFQCRTCSKQVGIYNSIDDIYRTANYGEISCPHCDNINNLGTVFFTPVFKKL